MKKRWLFVVIIGILIYFILNFESDISEETITFKNKNDSLMSIMLETEVKSGIYEKSSGGGWPTDGYKFNTELSKCDNGGELTWDNDKKIVVMTADSINKCYVYFDLSEQSLSDYVISQFTGIQGENAMYYHDSTLANGASDNSYRYAGADYVLTDKAKNAGYTSVLSGQWLNNSVNLIGIYCKGKENAYVLYSCSTDDYYYKVKYDTTTEFTTYHEVIQKAYNDGYIDYNVKNFVCFGSDEVPCPTNNLYRIIGVFEDNYHGVSGQQLVKLIKWDLGNDNDLGTNGDALNNFPYGFFLVYKGVESENLAGTYYWNNNTTVNVWTESYLYEINLNTNFINYLNGINSKWSNRIESVVWQVAGNDDSYIRYDGTPSISYQYEVKNPKTSSLKNDEDIVAKAKIGLMYVSDYGFAVDANYWTYKMLDYRYLPRDNWLYMGEREWTITRSAGDYGDVFYIDYEGQVKFDSPTIEQVSARPTFFVKSIVKYESGIGTMEDPIRLAE